MSVDITLFAEPTDPDFAELRGMAIASLSLEEMQYWWRQKHLLQKPLDFSKDTE
jgi:hypothetical protein